jgi:hypothetical protein
MKFFTSLSQEELQHLQDAIPQIAILIAGADGNIDAEEREWADKLTNIRAYAGDKVLHEYYETVHANFSIRFNDMLKTLPTNTAGRQEVLATNLSHLNTVLAKLDSRVAYHLYKSFVTYAKSIAEETGGFFRFGAISGEEKKWIGLPMLAPIAAPKEEPISDEASTTNND